jgi:S1-C subfamily serine protease
MDVDFDITGEEGQSNREDTAVQMHPRRRRVLRFLARWRGIGLFAAGIVTALLSVAAYAALTPPPHQLTPREVNTLVAQAMASATPPPAYSQQVYAIIQPSLVLIQVKTPDTNGKPEDGVGSGVIINANGDILTSLHVVTAATDIKLTFADGTESGARVVNIQPQNDIAVIRAAKLPQQVVPATLGNPGAVRVGDEAYVVGNPLGLYASMSSGVISGLNRSFKAPNSDIRMTGLFQIDAAVNPGNSGGPLLNRYGQVIGIVAALVNPTGQDVFIGIGFAVPINAAGGAVGMPLD